EVAYARRPARQHVCARTRRRTGAGGRVGPVLRFGPKVAMNPASRGENTMEKALVENQPAGQAGTRGARSKAPVFVLGCGRSGTKFLYHTLLSAGGFAVYHSESNAFNLLGLRFGNLARRRNRRQLLDAYFTSKLFQRTGLDPKDIEDR